MKKRKILMLLIIILGMFIFFRNISFNNISYRLNKFVSKITNTSEYKTIKQDINKNYSGIGQEKVKNKDGYFTTFTTIENHKKTYIEYKQNADSSWSNNQYWGGTMAENGCGITALATILSGYNKNYTPEDLRQQYYPKLNYDILSKELSNTFNIKNTDFYYDSVHLSKEKLQEHLETNRPILVVYGISLMIIVGQLALIIWLYWQQIIMTWFIFLILMVEKMIVKVQVGTSSKR